MTEIPNQNPETPPSEAPLADPEILVEQHPADVAEVIESLSPEQGADVLEHLPPEAAADALGQMDEQDAGEVVEDMAPEAAASAVSHMAPDDAADVLAELPEQQREEILEELPAEQREQIEDLMTYPPESAGGIMSPQVTAVSANLTVPEAIATLRRLANENEQIYYTYVVDADQRLVGVLSLRDLILAKETQRLHDIMIRKVVNVPAEMDREEVAALLTKYGYFAVPVVDQQGRLLGIVTVDDVVDVIRDEATEDMQRMVGAGADERLDSPVAFVLKRRIVWLLINLATAFLAAAVIGVYRKAIEEIVALAVLNPVVAGQAGNTGLQSMAVMVRGLATGEARGRGLLSILLREMRVGLTSGAVIGLICAGITHLWFRDAALTGVIGLAMLACMLIAAVSGALVPYVMKRLGFDPAQSASIILTTITDITGFGIFLALASWILVRGGGTG